VLAAAFAAGLVLATWMALLSAARAPGWLATSAACLSAGGMIVILCRVTMPAGVRASLILALIATMLFAVVRADPFGIRTIDPGVAQGIAEMHRDRRALARYAGFAPSDLAEASGGGGAGAGVAFVAGSRGGPDWARAINQAWNGRIGGVAARSLRITGTVDGLMPVAVDWAISKGEDTVRCGRTSVAGADRRVMVEAFGAPLAQAVRRSISLGRASCP
jgi:hypothetical protein